MADWSALVKGFQEGANFSQNFRERRQIEKARDLGLEGATYDMESRRANRKVRDPMTQSVLGKLDPNSVHDWNGALPDPFAFKLFDWIKSKTKKKKKAIDTGSITPTGPVSQGDEAAAAPAPPQAEDPQAMAASPAAEAVDAQAYPTTSDEMPDQQDPNSATPGYADGGDVSEEDKIRERAKANRARSPGRVENATEEVSGADRTATAAKATDAAKQGLLRRAINSPAGRLGGALAAAGAMSRQTDPGYDERIAQRFGWEDPTTAVGSDPSVGGFAKFLGKRALGYASDLGDILTGGAAGNFYSDNQGQPAPQPAAQPAPAAPGQPPQRMALPPMQVSARPPQRKSALQAQPEMADFSNIDIDAKEVPDMKTDDWKQYRAQVMDAARQSGNPEAVSRANDLVTEMQQKGFLNYGKQGLALQQAGNVKGAMAAYRAAYQYFPNGHDVEFGVHKGQIVGVGKDEATGKVVPGTAMVMDPERVSALLENFTNPQAFRMWTKDWRDFKQGQKQYNEVTKPLAQAQIQHLGTTGEADIIRAQADMAKAGKDAAGSGAGMRNAEHVFRQSVEMLGIQDEPTAQMLSSVMSRVKSANPTVPDNTIVQAVMQAHRDGSLQQRLKAMGIQ